MYDYRSITEKILTMTRSMLESARTSEWEKVQSQQQKRQLLLKELDLSKGLEGQYGKDVAFNLKETLKLNGDIVDMSVHAKADLEKSIGSVQRGRKANLAYRVLG
jgi:hypothetical protein